MDRTPSPNFAFLAYHDVRLVALGTQAEALFAVDMTACLAKTRQLDPFTVLTHLKLHG